MRLVLGLVLGLFTGCTAASRVTRPGGLEIVTIAFESTNAHLVVQDGKAVLFDSGYETNAPKLEAALREAGIDPATQLKAIVVSHGHADHAGGARHFQTMFKVPVIVGSGDEAMFASGKNEPLCPVGLIANLRVKQDQEATYTGGTPEVIVKDSLSLRELTGLDAKVTLLPGHTRGSIILTVGDIALVGDLLRGDIVGFGAETHFFMCDLEGNKRDIDRVLSELAPRAKVIFVGHFGPVSPQDVRQHFSRPR